MKRFFSVTAILFLILFVTACSASVQSNNPEQETIKTTSVNTTIENSTTNSSDEKHTEINETTEEITETAKAEASVEHSTKKQSVTNKVTTKPSVTEKPVATTKKPETTTASSKKLPAYSPETEIITLVNKINNYRVQNGLNKISLDSELCKMAYIRATEQKILEGHDRPDGSKYFSILDEYNYEYTGCGENIAFLSGLSSEVAFNLWKNSSSHNQNMLGERWTKCGIALYIDADGSYNIVNLFAC